MKNCTLGCRSFSCWLGLSWARAAAGDAALFAPLSALFSRRGGQRAGCSAAAATAATGALGAVFPRSPQDGKKLRPWLEDRLLSWAEVGAVGH